MTAILFVLFVLCVIAYAAIDMIMVNEYKNDYEKDHPYDSYKDYITVVNARGFRKYER